MAAFCGSSNRAGTEITARAGAKPSCSVTSARSDFSTSADSCSGSSSRLEAGKPIFWPVPIKRLNSPRTLSGSLSKKRRALAPTITLPLESIRTTDGVSEVPWALRIRVTWEPSKAQAVELVVPRSIPR